MPRPDLPREARTVQEILRVYPDWLVQTAGVEDRFKPWKEGFESAIVEFRFMREWPGTVNDHCRWLVWIGRLCDASPSLIDEYKVEVRSLYCAIRSFWYRFVTPDYEITIEPTELLTATVSRTELRTVLRLARKFGKADLTDPAYIYTADGKLWVEYGSFRSGLDCPEFWEGCVNIRGALLVDFWNTLPKGKLSSIQYETGLLTISGLRLGRATWQPKPDSDRMQREGN